jgi:hypothetical protein
VREPRGEPKAQRRHRLRQVGGAQVEQRLDETRPGNGAAPSREGGAGRRRVLAAERLHAELDAARTRRLEQRRPDAAPAPRRFDEQMDEARRRRVHVEARHAALRVPVEALVRVRLVAQEGERLVDAALGFARRELRPACALDRDHSEQNVLRRRPRVDLLDAHQRLAQAAVA